jgi:hydroxymethylglutaryl-CoA lyase
MIRITECPRDAMQGIRAQIPAEKKAAYINRLLKVGFDVIDFGSFVSPKAIPQMADTAQVLGMLDLSVTKSRLLAIVANVRGAEEACSHKQIDILGYPFSISETFQQRNANSTIAESLERVKQVKELCELNGKVLRVYISMAFGNPYGDEWSPALASQWCHRLAGLGIRDIALADTTGSSTTESIAGLFSVLVPEMDGVVITAHLHSTPEQALDKISAAYDNGCRSFDVAIHGFGGCPMAGDALTGNIATETLETLIRQKSIPNHLNLQALNEAYSAAWDIFNNYH